MKLPKDKLVLDFDALVQSIRPNKVFKHYSGISLYLAYAMPLQLSFILTRKGHITLTKE